MGKQDATKSALYAALVAEAEAAVSAMKDPELRRVAFEKVLMTLLDNRQPIPKGPGGPTAPPKAKKASRAGKANRSRQGPKAYIAALIDDGFFKKQRTIAEVKAELANQGRHIALSSLSGPLQKLTQERRLRRQKVTTGGKGSKTTYAYSNW